jgi:hypothetical protein
MRVNMILRLVPAEGDDPELLADLARDLAGAIETGCDGPVDVAPAAGRLPAGARGAEALAIGALLAAVAPVAVEQLLGLLRDWAARPGARPVRISLERGDRRLEAEFDASQTPVEEVVAAVRRLEEGLER